MAMPKLHHTTTSPAAIYNPTSHHSVTDPTFDRDTNIHVSREAHSKWAHFRDQVRAEIERRHSFHLQWQQQQKRKTGLQARSRSHSPQTPSSPFNRVPESDIDLERAVNVDGDERRDSKLDERERPRKAERDCVDGHETDVHADTDVKTEAEAETQEPAPLRRDSSCRGHTHGISPTDCERRIRWAQQMHQSHSPFTPPEDASASADYFAHMGPDQQQQQHVRSFSWSVPPQAGILESDEEEEEEEEEGDSNSESDSDSDAENDADAIPASSPPLRRESLCRGHAHGPSFDECEARLKWADQTRRFSLSHPQSQPQSRSQQQHDAGAQHPQPQPPPQSDAGAPQPQSQEKQRRPTSQRDPSCHGHETDSPREEVERRSVWAQKMSVAHPELCAKCVGLLRADGGEGVGCDDI